MFGPKKVRKAIVGKCLVGWERLRIRLVRKGQGRVKKSLRGLVYIDGKGQE